MQQGDSSFFQKYGQRIAQANEEHQNKPIDTGNQRLPGGIDGGVAKLQILEIRVQEKEDGKIPKGERFLYAQAAVLHPAEHGGRKVEGLHTFQQIPLCDIAAKGKRKASSFSDNWDKYQNMFKLLSNGAMVCRETTKTDPTGMKAWNFYVAAAKSLTMPNRPPVFVSFSTRAMPVEKPIGWKEGDPLPEAYIHQVWHGLAEWNGKVNPAAGIMQSPPSEPLKNQPSAFVEPPQGQTEYASVEDEVNALVEVLESDPQCETQEGADAASRLEELALANGWDADQISNADQWSTVGDMATAPPKEEDHEVPANETGNIGVGSKWKFKRRGRDGQPLKNNKGEEFPAREVEVVQLNTENKTVAVKTTDDNKLVISSSTKKPLEVKYEWLE